MPGEPPGPSDPLDPAALVGRAAEAAAIRRMLDGAPLITVTGLPGVGKTAVSLAAARAAAAGFADGSLLPSSIGVNPMMTIIAMASRVAGSMTEALA